ncbi:MAG: carboxyl transferase domain-containing protein [Nitriliruptorales bacterium]|nr:carboxyl transferase domain-containing protein [Nitriliruptorales bacterium]
MTDQDVEVESPTSGLVSHVAVDVGDAVGAGDDLVVLEVMKMEHPVAAPAAGVVVALGVAPGDEVAQGDVLLRLSARHDEEPAGSSEPTEDPDAEPELLEELRQRKQLLRDEARPEAVSARHERGHRTARENIDDLLDGSSFVEYGGLAIAAQRNRKPREELLRDTPADGLVTGTGTVNAKSFGVENARVAVAAYDYTVLAGTQGHTNHLKKDRLFELAASERLPVVLFAEGGGGRPGDTDVVKASHLDVPAFHLFARLSGTVPLVAVVNGRSFAGNAALAGCADVIIATDDTNLGMAGPAMIEGGGLGKVTPDDIGPAELHRRTGVIDVPVSDEAEAVAVAKRYLGYFQGDLDDWDCADQAALRDAIPGDRRRVYEVRPIIDTVFDRGSVLELRPDHAAGMLTCLARIEGRPVGVIANDPGHLAGAIDGDGADSAARLLALCDAFDLPVVALVDTPGFMVGPDAEEQAQVRRFGRLFAVGANLSVPMVAVVTRRAYGLGAQAMMGGHLKVPVATVGWPTSELGPMGLEGAVRLGFRRELEAIEDPEERAEREQQMIELAYANAQGLNVATFAEIDDVIDPAATRDRIRTAIGLRPHRPAGWRHRSPRRPHLELW